MRDQPTVASTLFGFMKIGSIILKLSMSFESESFSTEKNTLIAISDVKAGKICFWLSVCALAKGFRIGSRNKSSMNRSA